MVQALRLKTDPWRVHEAKNLLPIKGVHNGQAAILTASLYVFAASGHIQFFKPLLT